MLLDEVLAELSEKVLQNAENQEPCWLTAGEINTDPFSSIPEETVAFGESLDDENSSLLQTTVKSIRSPGKEIKLPLESEEKFSKNLQSQNSECFSGFYGATASIPFQWEEKPGKPKHPSTEAANISLRLPPIRQSGLYFHVGDSKLRKKLPGRLKTIMQGKPSGFIKASKLSNERNRHRQEFSSDYANSDLESIHEEEEDEEEMLELCTKTDPFREFQEMHFRRSYDSSFNEGTDQCMLRVPDFPNNSRRMPLKTAMVAKSAEFAPKRAHSYNTWSGFRSTELGLQFSGLSSRRMVDNPFSESPLLSCRSSVSDGVWPSISRSASNSDLASARLANCLIPVMDMLNAVPVEDSRFSSRSPPKIITPKTAKKDRLENDGSWASLVQKSLSGQLMSTQKYHQKLMRAQSMQSAGSLNALKRVSSMVKRTVWDSPRSLSMRSMEYWSLEKLRKTHMETSRHSVENEEESMDMDGSVIDDVFSPEGSSCALVDAESGSSTPFLSETSSNSCRDMRSCRPEDTNSFLDLVASGLQGSNSCQDRMNFLDFPTPENLHHSIQATSTRVHCLNNVQAKFEDGLTHGASMENTEPGEYMWCSEKHSKGRNRTKRRVFCTPLRISVNSCCFLSGKHTEVKPIP